MDSLKALVQFFTQEGKSYRLIEDKDEMNQLAGTIHHEGICMVSKTRPMMTLHELFEQETRRANANSTPPKTHSTITSPIISKEPNRNPSVLDRPIIVVLDNMEMDNVGPIIRSCASFGVRTVISLNQSLLSNGESIISPSRYLTSRGAMEYVDIVETPSITKLGDILMEFKVYGWEIISIIGRERNAPLSIFSDDSIKSLGTKPLIVLLGSDGKGISSTLLRLTDKDIHVPSYVINGGLNASQSISIILSECWRLHGRK
ncbi:hypothetical protein SAMD00019534_101660 [Acytostelium subglobosum LB1]|uniref:hypothetical protein n=1 Tax=Acytostelium subglobosum LB1 TaxID=1410327 RepID=UPI0006451BC5|nr:hypothetical protein SAMD00019534_101660 [Acytostelium subglobosum LB1]GAM26991.1 hypothetical protein SAMD00019534_101660 [Acytostelium subglobosum LB1]|eukprot:XP_012749871.1 hypothetical protein SAMD00019534_101660 [Acytostelium subglobosum LB1]